MRISISLLLVLSACATITVPTQPKCSTLVPKAWAERIAGEPLPDLSNLDELYNSSDPSKQKLANELEKREWQKWGTGNVFRLSIAQNRSEDTLTIIRNCEDLVAQSNQKTAKKWWQFWK